MSHPSDGQRARHDGHLCSPWARTAGTPRHSRTSSKASESSQRDDRLFDQDIADNSDIQGLGLTELLRSRTDGSSFTRRKVVFTNLTPDLSQVQSHTHRRGSSHGTPDPGLKRGLTPDSSRPSLADGDVQYEDISDQVHLIERETRSDAGECCPTHGDILRERVSKLSIVFILLAIFSWAGSGVFFGIAVAKPHWGHRIGPGKSLTYGTATFLCVLFSKLVEITFACSYVAALGQFLSRKAFPKNNQHPNGRGISLAEINLRLWILQPGTLITHWEGAKYVITKFLGIVTLAAALAAMFYTSSVEALVSPKLKFGANETRIMYGQVVTSFANNEYLGDTCQTSIPSEVDPEHGGSTCLQISFAGNGFHNLETWQGAWRTRQRLDNLENVRRPEPVASLYENTTVHGQWIRPSGEDFTLDSAKHDRLVLNVTMAMPNANVFRAAREPTNRILQPGDLGGAGQYHLKAAVPVPAVNALCVGATENEVQVMVGNETVPPPQWQTLSTPLDSFFGWSNEPDHISTSYHPWFGKLPIIFNSVGNTTLPIYGLRHIYFLANPPPETETMDYILCGIRVFQYNDCSTTLFVAQAGNDLSVRCENDTMKWRSYKDTATASKPVPLAVEAKEWTTFGAEWIRSLALTHGISDGNASSARLLAQMIPPYSNSASAQLPLDTPTVAEALCVLAGHTLLLSSDFAPFHPYWNYTKQRLQVPTLQSFESIITSRDYVSGSGQDWEIVFYIVLAIVFILNCVCVALLFIYYCKYGEITDYTEPQNLFALAINSPPSQTLAGACGCGPTGKMLGQRWCVDMKTTPKDTPNTSNGVAGAHFYVRYPDEEPLVATSSAQPTPDSTAYSRTNRFSRFLSSSSPRNDSPILMTSKKRTRTSATEIGGEDSPAVAQYMKLVGRD